MSVGQANRRGDSMTLLTEMMQRPLDPGYAAAAQRRQQSGQPAAAGLRSPLLIMVAVLIGVLLAASALALRAPTTAVSTVKKSLVAQIESRRAHADAQTRLIATLRSQIDTAQAAALSQQSEGGLAAELSKLEIAAGTVTVSGPGLLLTLDDAPAKTAANSPDADPRTVTGLDQSKVFARDLQIIVNGLWDAGAEAISVNGHRLTSRAAIRSAGAAILVDYRPLTRPYLISAIGDPGSLGVEFADNSGGSYVQSLTNNYHIRSDIKSLDAVVVPGEPTLSLQDARPVDSAVTGSQDPTRKAQSAPQTTAPRTTETSP
ncbi:MAG: hypothetical protein QOF35_225 [Actinomycetota bacterium]|nr:hypothetical protein [Actinomycetota bacterium]